MLHGVALGDALGAPVEKLSAADIRGALRAGDLARYALAQDGPAARRRGTDASAATASSPTTR